MWASNKELADYLKENEVYTKPIDEIISLADNFTSIHGVKKFVGTKNNYSKEYTVDRPKNESHANKPFTNTFKNFKSDNFKAKKNSNITCYNCKKPGHTQNECWFTHGRPQVSNIVTLQNKDSRNNVETVECERSLVDPEPVPLVNLCSVAKGQTIVSKSLPVTFGSINGVTVKVLRDTGATDSVVRKSLIKPEQFTGKIIEVSFANGTIENVPEAEVVLHCPLYNGNLKVLCLDNTHFDVLLGNGPNISCACVVEAELVEKSSNIVNAVQTRAQLKVEQDLLDEEVMDQTKPNNKKIKCDVEIDLTKVNSKELIGLQQIDETLKKCYESTKLGIKNNTGYSRRKCDS